PSTRRRARWRGTDVRLVGPRAARGALALERAPRIVPELTPMVAGPRGALGRARRRACARQGRSLTSTSGIPAAPVRGSAPRGTGRGAPRPADYCHSSHPLRATSPLRRCRVLLLDRRPHTSRIRNVPIVRYLRNL